MTEYLLTVLLRENYDAVARRILGECVNQYVPVRFDPGATTISVFTKHYGNTGYQDFKLHLSRSLDVKL